MGLLATAAAGLSGAGTAISGYLGYKSAKDQQDALKKQAKRTRKDLSPWRTTGGESLNELWRMMQEGPGEFDPEDQPGYKYGFEEFIQKPMDRGASARGRYFSPGTTKALGRRAQDYAETSYDNFLNRYYQKLKPYFSLSESGRGAASQTGQLARYDPGNQPANALTAMVGGLSNIGNKALQYYQTQNMLNQAQAVPNTNVNALGYGRGGV